MSPTAAGCAGSGAPSGHEQPEVTFLAFGTPEELAAYRDVITGFMKEPLQVTVKLIEASDRKDLLTRLSTSFAGGTPPDLSRLNYRFYAQFAAKGVLEPVED